MLAAGGITVLIVVIIILVLLIALAVTVLVIINKVKRTVSSVTRGLVTPKMLSDPKVIRDMTEGLKEGMTETGPRSVSGMTSLMLPKITRDFPDFEYDEMREHANVALMEYFKAINERDENLLNGVGREVIRTVHNKLMQMKTSNRYRRYEGVKIHRTEIKNYNKASGRCVITFQTSVGFKCTDVNSSGSVLNSSDVETRYEVDMVYVQDRDLIEHGMEDAKTVNCPNCGAPITSLGSKSCSYCGAPVIELNLKAWVFNRVAEDSR